MDSVGAIVLAAGNSSRLGKPKQFLEFYGETLVHSAVRAAIEGGCEIVCVVTGAQRETVESAVADLHPLLVHDHEWERGMGSSIRSGVQRLRGCSALVLLSCDQPALNASIVRALIRTHEETGRPIVASHYAETLGIPALFSRDCFEELLRLPDDHGAKPLIAADPSRVAGIEFADGEVDIDTPEDLQTWRSRPSNGRHGSSSARQRKLTSRKSMNNKVAIVLAGIFALIVSGTSKSETQSMKTEELSNKQKAIVTIAAFIDRASFRSEPIH